MVSQNFDSFLSSCNLWHTLAAKVMLACIAPRIALLLIRATNHASAAITSWVLTNSRIRVAELDDENVASWTPSALGTKVKVTRLCTRVSSPMCFYRESLPACIANQDIALGLIHLATARLSLLILISWVEFDRVSHKTS